MKITPLAGESLGVRSMATLVETEDVRILIDPSAALGPSRYGLPPTPEELKALSDAKTRIRQTAKSCGVFVITHYHYDHYDPDEQFYFGKKVFAKSIEENINKSQTGRGREFREIAAGKCDLVYADNNEYEIGKTKLKFSPAVPHGDENTRLGFVIMCTIDDGTGRALFASDVAGPVCGKTADYIISERPGALIMDGPATYFLGWKFSRRSMEQSRENLLRIIGETGCEVLLDHHLLRDLKYKDADRFGAVYETKRVKSFAEYIGKKNKPLEAERKEWWGENGGGWL